MIRTERVKTQKAIFYPEHNPRASGMRLATCDAMRPAFIETFVQSIFDVYLAQGKSIQSIVVGSDGRYFTVNARDTVIRVALANGVKKIYTTPNGLMTTPACSLLTKEKADLSILLTASHNEGGLDKDFGIKVEKETGGLISVGTCEALIECMQKMTTFKTISDSSDALYLRPEIEFVDAIKTYADAMENLFDFDVLRDFLKNKPLILDTLHGAGGPYLKEIFENRLSVKNLELRHNAPLPDFAKGHPEPNPTFAKDLYQELLSKTDTIGCAFDADVDRYMIVSEGRFLAPPDLLAMAAKNLSLAKGYSDGVAGVARSMPTARIVDYVAKDLGLPCYEVPTAWVFFTNLLNAGKITLCGEESFGIGSNHIQEKDGIWGLLVWLNTLAVTGQSTSDILTDLWTKYGRFYTCRYDYETTVEKAQSVFDYLASGPTGTFGGYTIESVDEFNFTDPVTGKQALHQGWVMSFTDGSRVITRLSNTGTKGALLRFYLEKREMKDFTADSFEMTKDLGEAGLLAFDMEKYLGKIKPDIIVKG